MEPVQVWLGRDTAICKIAFVAVTFVVLPLALVAIIWTGNNRLSSFPGPRLAAWTRLYSVAAVLTGNEHEKLLEAHEKYGPFKGIPISHLLTHQLISS